MTFFRLPHTPKGWALLIGASVIVFVVGALTKYAPAMRPVMALTAIGVGVCLGVYIRQNDL